MLKSFNFKVVNSTNDIAIRLIKKKNIKSGFVIAQNQKKGRGRRGNKWISYKGNLFISVFFSLEKINLNLKQVTKKNAKLIINLISKYYKKKIQLKLPNDILINKKKICGILQETVEKNEVKYLVVGIGLNLIKSPNINSYDTTNLYELTTNKISIRKISNELKILYKNFLIRHKVFQ